MAGRGCRQAEGLKEDMTKMNRSMDLAWCCIAAFLCAMLSGCGNTPGAATVPKNAPASGLWQVVATTGMVADLVRQVGEGRVKVESLMGEGVDPHLYKPTVRDVKLLESADLVFYNGLMLEGRMQDVLQRLQASGRPVFAVTDGIPRDRLIAPEGFAGHYDPHVWMDVGMWSLCVDYVAECLERVDPQARDVYRANAARYKAELEELDEYVRRVIGSIPEPHRVLVTAHDAFHYFSRAYQIPVRAPQGISTETEPGVKDINDLVQFLVDRRIRAIFVETSVPEANVRAVLEGAARLGWRVQVGGALFSDAMGPPGTYEGTYIGMLDHNATVIARALGGQAPPRGMKGRLSVGESGKAGGR
ncbi:MAG: manganese transporter [Pirellulaceae bacterium]|nr:MAG: manganese transporter [Pirellulaceae bacterium]